MSCSMHVECNCYYIITNVCIVLCVYFHADAAPQQSLTVCIEQTRHAAEWKTNWRRLIPWISALSNKCVCMHAWCTCRSNERVKKKQSHFLRNADLHTANSINADQNNADACMLLALVHALPCNMFGNVTKYANSFCGYVKWQVCRLLLQLLWTMMKHMSDVAEWH